MMVMFVAVVPHARHFGAYLQSQNKSHVEKLMAERYRPPETRETQYRFDGRRFAGVSA